MNKTKTNPSTRGISAKQKLQAILSGSLGATHFQHAKTGFDFKRFSIAQARWLMWYIGCYQQGTDIAQLMEQYGTNALVKFYYLVNKAGLRLIYTGHQGAEEPIGQMTRSTGEMNFYSWLAQYQLDQIQPKHRVPDFETMDAQRNQYRRPDLVTDAECVYMCQVLHRYIHWFYPKAVQKIKESAAPISEDGYTLDGLSEALHKWLQAKTC